MATAQQIRDLITQTTSGTVRLRVPCEVCDEVCGDRTNKLRFRQCPIGGIPLSGT
jgi:hypothetical protein